MTAATVLGIIGGVCGLLALLLSASRRAEPCPMPHYIAPDAKPPRPWAPPGYETIVRRNHYGQTIAVETVVNWSAPESGSLYIEHLKFDAPVPEWLRAAEEDRRTFAGSYWTHWTHVRSGDEWVDPP